MSLELKFFEYIMNIKRIYFEYRLLKFYLYLISIIK